MIVKSGKNLVLNIDGSVTFYPKNSLATVFVKDVIDKMVTMCKDGNHAENCLCHVNWTDYQELVKKSEKIIGVKYVK